MEIFRGNEEEALRAFLLSLLTKDQKSFPFDPRIGIWEQTELLSPVRGGDVRNIPDIWFKLCLLSYSDGPYPSTLKISGTEVSFVDLFYSRNSTRCFCFQIQDQTVFVFAPFLPKSLWEEISLGFGTMCQTNIDQSCGIHQGIKELSQDFSRFLSSHLFGKEKVCLVGMSMGGAIATASCWDLRKNGWTGEITLYTFGSPRVGNAGFSGWLRDNVAPDSFSAVLVSHRGREVIADPVTLFPPKSKGYEDSPFLYFLKDRALFKSEWLRSTQPDLDISVSSCLSGLVNFSDIRKYGISNMGIGERNEEWEISHNPQAYFDNISG